MYHLKETFAKCNVNCYMVVTLHLALHVTFGVSCNFSQNGELQCNYETIMHQSSVGER